VSHKEIIAIHTYGLENDRKRGGSGLSGSSLVPPGRIFVLNQRFDLVEERLRAKAQSEPTKREIVIAAIVFNDGSFEGEPDVAAEMAADIAGQRLQFMRLMPLLRKAAASPGERESLKNLHKDIAALSQDFDPTIADELIARFSAASEEMRNRRIKEEVANGMRSLKGHVLREIERFEVRREASSDVEVSQWLNELIDNLERTLGQ
jgi:hypothetical protein